MSVILSGSLTVYFESPFWVGIFETIENGKIQCSRVVFGPEPKDYEVYEFISKNYYNLKYSKPLEVEFHEKKKMNPKRLHRKISKATKEIGISTKSQAAIKLEQESRKIAKKKKCKEKKEKEKKLKFEMKQEKKKEKKKGH
eukprot:gnl/Chilomastix_cuspidata/7040.p1 GENE.gnl/Chilomastix_cuspidata/7040~~gnl/Chilomastix_cuspidata/7040.p1  ORF type:complete len:141 (-),score=18.50 gnl/Chilomastix_cuspidata/7040:21-443(-)